MEINESYKEDMLNMVKKDYIDQITKTFIENPYEWQKKMTIVNMIIITLGKEKEYKLYKYDDFCCDILNFSKNSFDEARLDALFTSEIEFAAIIIKHSGDQEKALKEMASASMEKLKKSFSRLEKIMLKKMLKKVLKEDYSAEHDEFMDDYYGKKDIDSISFYEFLKNKE